MFKRLISITCALTMVISMPLQVLGQTTIGKDESVYSPIYGQMETKQEANGITQQIAAIGGNAALTQDRKVGNYSLKVYSGNTPSTSYTDYILQNSYPFQIADCSNITLWVKPGSLAKWIEFYTDNDKQIASDKNKDGRFEVGKDLVSGKWNKLTLDLTKMKTAINQGQGLKVRVNKKSTWFYDEITSEDIKYMPVDLSKMTNSYTQLTDGAIQFKRGTDGGFDVNPTILIPNMIFERTDTTKNDFLLGTLDNTIVDANGNVQFNAYDMTTPTAGQGNAFDNNGNTFYVSTETGNNVKDNAYIAYDFGTPRIVKKITVQQSGNPNYIISTAVLQYYNGQENLWKDVQTLALGAAGAIKGFDITADIYASKWRILAKSAPAVGYSWYVSEVELYGYGTYTSPVINISSPQEIGNNRICAIASQGSELSVYTRLSINGGATWMDWKESSNDNGITDLIQGEDISNSRIQYKVQVKKSDINIPVRLEEVQLNIFKSDNATDINNRAVSKILINSNYILDKNEILVPSNKYTYPITPYKYCISGNSRYIYYVNSDVKYKIYRFDTLTGTQDTSMNNMIINSNYEVVDMKCNYDGSVVVVRDSNYPVGMYVFKNGIQKITTSLPVTNPVFDIYDNLLYYVESTGYSKIYNIDDDKISTASDMGTYNIVKAMPGKYTAYSVQNLTSNPQSFKIYYYNPYAVEKSKLIYSSTTEYINSFTVNKDETQIYYTTNSSAYSYNILSKSVKKLDIEYGYTIVKLADNERILLKNSNNQYIIYDPVSQKTTLLLTTDGTIFDLDNTGTKLYSQVVAGMTVSDLTNTVQKPEKYLLSFDYKKSWYTFKDGEWTLVKEDIMPKQSDFDTYGMTSDEINSITENDFKKLYNEEDEVYTVDVAVYFNSPSKYLSPSIKSINIITKPNTDRKDEIIPTALFTAKKQDFDALSWRKITKLYPQESGLKDYEMHYFIFADNKYNYYDGAEWETENAAEISDLLNDVKVNWIDITQKGMTAEQLKAIPQDILTTHLKGKTFSIVYALKVFDKSTTGYKSIIHADYIENQFTSETITLNILLNNGTTKQYTNLTKEQIEDFMEWVNKRQYGKGNVFYTIKSGSTSDFINYYMIQNVNVVEQ